MKLKRVRYLPLVVILVLVLLAAGTQTQPFRDMVRGMAEARLGAALGGDVSVGRVSGNLVTGFVAEGVVCRPGTSAIRLLSARSIRAQYRPWRLLRGRLDVVSLAIDGLVVEVAVDSLSGTPGGEESRQIMEPAAPASRSPLSRIAVGELLVRDGAFVLVRGDEREEISDIDVDASFRPTLEGFGLLVDRMTFALPERLLGHVSISGMATYDSGVGALRVSDFRAQTPSSVLGGELTLGQGVVALKTSRDGVSLSLTEIGRLLRRPGEEWRGQLTGEFVLAWMGETLEGAGRIALSDVRAEGWRVDSFLADAFLRGDSLRFQALDAEVGEGRISGDAILWRSGGKIAASAAVDLLRFDLQDLSPTLFALVPSTLTGDLLIAGTGRDQGDYDLQADMTLVKSVIAGLEVDAAIARVHIDEERVALSRFSANCFQGIISGQGWLGGERMYWEVSAEGVDGRAVERLAGLEGVEGRLDVAIVLDGLIEGPSLSGRVEFHDGSIGHLSFNHLSGAITLEDIRRPLQGTGMVSIMHASVAGEQFRQARFQFTSHEENRTGFHLRIDRDEGARVAAEGRMKIDGDELWGEITDLSLAAAGIEMRNVTPLTVHRSPRELTVYPTVLQLVNGELTLAAEMDSSGVLVVQTSASKLDLAALGLVLGLNWEIKGLLDFELRASGSPASPEIDAWMVVHDPAIRDIRGDVLRARCSYRDRRLTLASATLERAGSVSEAHGVVSIDLGLRDVAERFPDEPTNLEAVLNDVGVWIFYPLSDLINITQGRVDANISVGGTMRHPEYGGEMTLRSGRLEVRPLGAVVNEVGGYATFSGDTLKLESISGKTETGFVQMKGSVRFAAFLPQEVDLRILASQVLVAGIPDVSAVVDGDVTVTGLIASPTVIGSINVTRGEVTRPFGEAREERAGRVPFEYDLKITAERGLWLRNDEAEIELQGELTLRSEGNAFTLVGYLRSLRGAYYYFDRRLEIESADIRFIDPTRLDPELDIWAMTVIRRVPRPRGGLVSHDSMAERVDVTIRLHLTGTLTKPVLELSADPAYFGQQDILTLLGLNLTTEELAQLQRGQVLGEEVPERVLAYFTERVLSRELRKRGFDMARLETEIFGAAEERSARLTVGKYVSDDLFVSYTHDLFAASGDAFKVEYYLGGQSSLVGERDEEKRYGLGVEFKFRY